jgi:hypothetical protein
MDINLGKGDGKQRPGFLAFLRAFGGQPNLNRALIRPFMDSGRYNCWHSCACCEPEMF